MSEPTQLGVNEYNFSQPILDHMLNGLKKRINAFNLLKDFGYIAIESRSLGFQSEVLDWLKEHRPDVVILHTQELVQYIELCFEDDLKIPTLVYGPPGQLPINCSVNLAKFYGIYVSEYQSQTKSSYLQICHAGAVASPLSLTAQQAIELLYPPKEKE